MANILLGQATEPQINWDALRGMFQLRHTVFKERLGWEVESSNGMETDHFDELDPVYMIAKDRQQGVSGCWRLLPTTGPYMLKDTFPQLLRGEPAPIDPAIWELSRFAVKPTASDDRRQANLGETTFAMMREVFTFGEQRGIESYVTVTSVALERMLRRIGLPIRRLGDGKAQRIGSVLSVACWIDLNEETRAALFQSAAIPEAARKVA